jgi:hypothetical protein
VVVEVASVAVVGEVRRSRASLAVVVTHFKVHFVVKVVVGHGGKSICVFRREVSRCKSLACCKNAKSSAGVRADE